MALNTNYNFIQRVPVTKNAFVGVVTLDADAAAERFAVLDRMTMLCYSTGVVALNKVAGVVKIIVPYAYTTAPSLTILIFDDGTVYDAVAADKVTADVFDIANAKP